MNGADRWSETQNPMGSSASSYVPSLSNPSTRLDFRLSSSLPLVLILKFSSHFSIVVVVLLVIQLRPLDYELRILFI